MGIWHTEVLLTPRGRVMMMSSSRPTGCKRGSWTCITFRNNARPTWRRWHTRVHQRRARMLHEVLLVKMVRVYRGGRCRRWRQLMLPLLLVRNPRGQSMSTSCGVVPQWAARCHVQQRRCWHDIGRWARVECAACHRVARTSSVRVGAAVVVVVKGHWEWPRLSDGSRPSVV